MSKYDDLEVKAKAATAGAWRRAATTFNGIVNGKFSFTKENIIATAVEKRDAEFIASADPQTVLELSSTDTTFNHHLAMSLPPRKNWKLCAGEYQKRNLTQMARSH